MTISAEEKHHGAALGRLLVTLNDELPGVFVRLRKGRDRSSYFLDCSVEDKLSRSTIGLYLKHSSARRTPWRYTFLRDHQEEIGDLAQSCYDVFLILINGNDGVACMDHKQLKQLLDDVYEDAEWITVSRNLRQPYHVSGRDGKLKKTLPRNSFPKAVVEVIAAALNLSRVLDASNANDELDEDY